MSHTVNDALYPEKETGANPPYAATNNVEHHDFRGLPSDDGDSLRNSSIELRNANEDVVTPKEDFMTPTIRPIRTNSLGSDDPALSAPRSWKTTFLRSGPLVGICCMMAAALSILVSLAILLGSRHTPVADWKVEPSAYLAICTAVANQALRFAAFQGVIVAWWERASRGSTLRQLHLDWRAGTTLLGALSSGRHMGVIGLACVFSTLVAVDGPLLQKSTTVVSAQIDQAVPLNVTLAPEVPTDFSGGWVNISASSNQMAWSRLWNESIPTVDGSTSNWIISEIFPKSSLSAAWLKEKPMKGVVRGCPGECRAKVKAPALAVTACTNKIVPVNYRKPYDYPVQNVAPPLDRYSFMSDEALIVDNQQESINLITAYAQVRNCTGTLNYTVCTLKPARGEYDVIVKDDTVTISPPGIPHIVALANNAPIRPWSDTEKWHPSTLAGIVNLGIYHGQGADIYFNDSSSDALTEQLIGANSVKFQIYLGSYCSSFLDPRDFALRDLNGLMFEAGMVAAQQYNTSYLQSLMDPGLEVESTITGYLQGQHNVFHTNLHWFLAAALVEGICIALILPTCTCFARHDVHFRKWLTIFDKSRHRVVEAWSTSVLLASRDCEGASNNCLRCRSKSELT